MENIKTEESLSGKWTQASGGFLIDISFLTLSCVLKYPPFLRSITDFIFVEHGHSNLTFLYTSDLCKSFI